MSITSPRKQCEILTARKSLKSKDHVIGRLQKEKCLENFIKQRNLTETKLHFANTYETNYHRKEFSKNIKKNSNADSIFIISAASHTLSAKTRIKKISRKATFGIPMQIVHQGLINLGKNELHTLKLQTKPNTSLKVVRYL